ncbi:MAG TPA: efflux transporter outer membrane subunit [Burkholderiales bacterium]
MSIRLLSLQHVCLGLAVVLAGCAAVGPDYKTPETEVSAGYVSADEAGFSTEQVDVTWWRGFNDTTLNQLVEVALNNNHDLRIATANLLEARALRQQTEYDRYPTVTAEGFFTQQHFSNAALLSGTGSSNEKLYQLGFDATWELDFFGRVRRSIEAQSAQVGAAEATRRDVIVSLIAEVARNYFELRGIQHQLDVALKNAANQHETLNLTLELLEGGQGTELDTSRAREQWNSTLATIPLLQAAVQRSIYRLGVLTGQQPQALLSDLKEPAPLAEYSKLIVIGKPEELLRRRPDIRVAERNLAATTALIGVATADLFPRVTFRGLASLEGNTFSGLGDSGSGTYLFGPVIRWEAVFNYGRVKARILAADARAEANLALYEKTVLTALEETENALVEFTRERARRDYLRAAVEASEKASSLAQQRFQEGATDFLTVLDSERRLLETQQNLAQSETSTATSLVAVYKALGGGWEIEQPLAAK